MAARSKAQRPPPSLAVASPTNNKKLNAERQKPQRAASRVAGDCCELLVGGGFGGRVHAMLGDFVDAASGRLDALAVEMIERHAAFPDGVAFFDGFCNVGFGECGGFQERATGSEQRGKCCRKRAAGCLGV